MIMKFSERILPGVPLQDNSAFGARISEGASWQPPPERGLSSPQQRRTAGGLQALTGTVRRPRVAADGKSAEWRVPRCVPLETRHLAVLACKATKTITDGSLLVEASGSFLSD